MEPTTAGIIPVQVQPFKSNTLEILNNISMLIYFQATGPRPPTLANVKVDAEDVAEGTKPEAQQSILRKYVRL